MIVPRGRYILFAFGSAAILMGMLLVAIVRADPPGPQDVQAPAARNRGDIVLPPRPARHAPDFPRPPAAAARPAEEQAPDLSVLVIGRTPRYPRYCLDYSRDVPELCPGTAGEQRFPASGEPVTFTAQVANQGQITSTATAYTWTLDGGIVQTGGIEALGPGEALALAWPWSWQSGAHTVTLSVAAAGAETTLANNSLDHRSDAHYLEVLIHPYFVQAFEERRNLVGSYSFVDWLQAQFRQMNQRLAAVHYTNLPAGLPDRIRIDAIDVTEAVGGDIVEGERAFDGRWSFRPARDLKRTPVDEAWESAQNYAAAYAGGIDWGLIHELAHQLGLIDLYQLNVSPSAGNEVHDEAGLPLLSGFQWPQPGLMGGDTSPGGITYFSEHSALALATNSGFRRGYYGEYLFDLPPKIGLRLLDNGGQPLAGATITGYQSERNVVRSEPVFTGLSDGAGLFLLPKRAVTPTLTTATGHTFRPNPFGPIDVVGRNGQLLLRIGGWGQEAFYWLPISELNKAVWAGKNEVILSIETHFSAVPLPPPALSLRSEGNSVALKWQPVGDAAAYNLYAAVWPRFDAYRLVQHGISATVASEVITTATRFALTAVNAGGEESAFSNIARAELLHAPGGLVWEAGSPYGEGGQLTVVDAHSGAMLRLLPSLEGGPSRWLGRMGSEHFGQNGVTAAALDGAGAMAVALGGGRAWVFDANLEPFNWFGRIGDLPPVLERPAGIALPGPALDLAPPLPWPDPGAYLLLSLDGTLAGAGGQTPLRTAQLAYAPGRRGQALRISEGSVLQYEAEDFPVAQGGVEFWLQPQWSGDDKTPHVLLEVGDPARDPASEGPGYLLRLAASGGGGMYAWATDFEDVDRAAWGEIATWRAGEWHHVAATWEAQRLNLHVDGRLLWGEALPVPITGTAAAIAVGGTLAGTYAADAVFDELRISRFPRLGNSDQVRVLVSEALTPTIKVFDLMGNRMSTANPAALAQSADLTSGQLALDPAGDIWLADEGGHRLHRFRLKGDTLTWAETLSFPFEYGPQVLAVSREGLLAANDGDHILILDPARAHPLVRVWEGPNDGSPGPFRLPAALAFGPGGALAVAERGNPRVSFIHEPAAPVLWLPLVRK